MDAARVTAPALVRRCPRGLAGHIARRSSDLFDWQRKELTHGGESLVNRCLGYALIRDIQNA